MSIEPSIVQLPEGLLEKAFPFYLCWDDDLRITSFGRSVAKALPELIPGKPLRDVFRLIRPQEEITAALFLKNSTLFLLESRTSGLKLRGQVLPLPDGGFLMLASAWMTEPEELERYGLNLADFAPHDQAVDLLQILQTHRMAIEDLKQLNKTLTRQRAELREKEAETRKLALVAARTDNAVVITDTTGHIEWVNDGFTRMTGWTLPEVIGKKPGSVLQGPETDRSTVAHVATKIHRGESVSVEILNYSKTGRKYWIAMEIQPIRDDDGKVINYMAVQRDITAEREADRKLRETAALQHAMLDSAGYAIIAGDIDGIITLFNPAAEKMLGYKAEEFIGKVTPGVFHDAEEVAARAAELTEELGQPVKPGFDAFVAKARLGKPDQREWTYIRKDGSRLPVLLSVSALTDGSKIVGYLGIATDLSERKAAEEKIRTTLSELERLNRVMMNREERVIELKREINSICQQAGIPPRYRSVDANWYRAV